MQQIKVNKTLVYLGVVAHECNISAVSRQLVIISAFFVLCRKKENCCEKFHRPPARHLADNAAFSWMGICSFHADIMWFMLLAQEKHTDAHEEDDLQTCRCSRNPRTFP